MEGALLDLVYVVIIIGIALLFFKLILDMIPMEARFKQLAWLLVMLVAALVLLARVFPLLRSALSG